MKFKSVENRCAFQRADDFKQPKSNECIASGSGGAFQIIEHDALHLCCSRRYSTERPDNRMSGSVNASSYLSFAGRTGLAYRVDDRNALTSTPENFKLATKAGLNNGAIYFEISPEAAMNKNPVILDAINRIHQN